MKTLRYQKGKQSGVMAKELVYHCLRVLTVVAVWAGFLKTASLLLDRPVDLSDWLVFVGGAFGAELLFLLFKKIFAKKGEQNGQDY